jgi:hypothetical protein
MVPDDKLEERSLVENQARSTWDHYVRPSVPEDYVGVENWHFSVFRVQPNPGR